MGKVERAKDFPPLDSLADPEDTLGWDREKHGRMADAAAPDDAVQVERAPIQEGPWAGWTAVGATTDPLDAAPLTPETD